MNCSKYHAKTTWVDNVRFASKREALHYMQLKALLKAGRIKDLELQPKFPMPPDTEILCCPFCRMELRPGYAQPEGSICTYIADFRYTWVKGPDAGKTMVVDVKGYSKEPYFRLKMRLMSYFYPKVKVTLA